MQKLQFDLFEKLMRFIPLKLRREVFPEWFDKDYPHFVIKGTFPTLNEYLSACGRNPKAGGRLKKQYLETAAWEIRTQMRGYVAKSPVVVHFVFYEPNFKRDKDNIASLAQKVIFDALQACHVIKNDGWKDVENFTHDFYVDKNNPRIEVYIEEIKE